MKKLKTMILKMIRRMLLWLLEKTQSKQKPNRKFEYTALDGTNFYTVPIGSLHRSRQILFQGIMNKMDLGVDNELLKELLEKIIKNAQAKNFNQVIKDAVNIQLRVDNIASPKLLYQASLLVIFMEDEPEEYNNNYIELKKRVLENDIDARFFFMAFVLNIIRNSQNTSIEELKEWIATLETEGLSDLENIINQKQ